MATSKLTRYLLFFYTCCLLFACNENVKQENLKNQEDFALVNVPISINENLKKISLEFIGTYNITNSIIEVTINKKETNEIYINLTCKGSAYFAVKKLTPSFTYELQNNTFFVFTGAEELLQLNFEEAKYKNRRQERCDSVITSCYLLQDNKMQKEENCSFPEPFSSMPAQSPPPLK